LFFKMATNPSFYYYWDSFWSLCVHCCVRITCSGTTLVFPFVPLGFGPLGICLHMTLPFPHSKEIDLCMGSDCPCMGLASPFAIIAIVYLAIIGVTWFACLLAVVTLLQFIVDVAPSTMAVLRPPPVFGA
jgi:hypothetical protein